MSLGSATRFDQTSGGTYLILAKAVAGDQTWNELTDLLEENTPSWTCKYEEDMPWYRAFKTEEEAGSDRFWFKQLAP